MRVTVETQPRPPERQYSEPFTHAVVYGDHSGIIAVCRDRAWADKIVVALDNTASFYGPLAVLPVVKIEP